MTFPFSAIVTASGAITFTCRDGASNTITRDNARYDEAKELLRQIGTVSEDEQTELINELVNISSPVKAIASDTGGRVFVREGKVFFRDIDELNEVEVHNVVAERVVWMISEGFDAKPMLGFLDHLMDNPSYRSVNDLYRFMERNQMGITPDGHLLAYKKVRSDFTDIYTGKFDNTPGQSPKMRRNEVEDNPSITCSKGLHVCSFSYLPNFGSSGSTDRVVVCKINPRDVVSVPTDYNDAKMRVCEYLVLKEIDYKGSGDVLGRQSVIDETVTLRDPEEADTEHCPKCGADIGDANYCTRCGWESSDDDDDNAHDEHDENDDEADDEVDESAHEHPPVIEFLRDGQWRELIGHCCSTAQEAENYVSSLDPSGNTMRVRKDDVPVVAPATQWPERKEDKAVDLRDAVSGVTQAAEGLFGKADVAVHMRLDGDGGLEVKMRPEGGLAGRVKTILIEHLGVDADQVTPDAQIMRDLRADSLDGVELVMAFEEEFGIDITDEETDKFGDATVSDVISFLEGKVERPV